MLDECAAKLGIEVSFLGGVGDDLGDTRDLADVVNDLVVKQDGELRYDWCEGTRLPLPVVATLNGCRDAGEVEGLNDPDFSRQLTRARPLDSSLGCREVIMRNFMTSERCG